MENPFEWRPLTDAFQHNCGIVEVNMFSPSIPEDLQEQIKEELAKNQEIGDIIFPVI